ncbi:receptor-like protein kinase FERONIA [Euphorbia lathyris]|uniref:receptor-like protein kinase FERONIA n=1 Tax=Euphorbia lathyris TaxID=212925 RepID=UPI003313E505
MGMFVFFFFFFLFNCCIVPFSAEDLSYYYAPSDSISIDCALSYPSSFSENQLHSTFSSVSRVYALHPDNRERPSVSACIYRNQFTHKLSVSVVGPKFIRFHFISVTYSGLSLSKALFSVSVGPYTLLTTSESSYSNLHEVRIVREFCINSQDQLLDLTFTPSSNISGAYAFVNKIEIVSMPSMLYIQQNIPLPLIGSSRSYSMMNSTALETIHRINIGGDLIPRLEDSGMFRSWGTDGYYFMSSDEDQTARIQSEIEIRPTSLKPVYAAPVQVYATARTVLGMSASNNSVKWSFPVESGFIYLVRLHFCEISSTINQDHQRVFSVDINNQTAEDHADIFNWRHGAGLPISRDYIVNFSRHGESIKYLSVSIRSNNGSSAGPILNGLEILKLSSDLSNNLAGQYPFGLRIHPNPNFKDKVEDNVDNHQVVILTQTVYVLAWSFLAMFPLSIFYMLVSSWRRTCNQQRQSSEHCRIFSIQEIKTATNNFADSLVVGSGGFGMVYKGCISIDGGTKTVAIKRANPNSHQGLREFQTEISMLSNFRHNNLLSLIGYASKGEEMILVYDYMAQGTLHDHLYKTRKPTLPWKERLKICIGAARGLHYLHTGTNKSIIHRDVKSSNILLDDKLVAKVSDFGLSSAMSESKTHVSTIVKGTFGYLDPEYYRRRKLTEKSDVYSFGVVLFETICARAAVFEIKDQDEEEERVNLAEWVLSWYQMGSVECIIDPCLKEKIAPECFKTFTDIGIKCLADKGSERPSMEQVLSRLEIAMQQQNASGFGENKAPEERMICGGEFIDFNHSDQTPGVEFSDIMFPTGR